MDLLQKWKLNISFVIVSASISFLASSIMAIMVLRSKTTVTIDGSGGLRVVPLIVASAFHRIILGLSASDMLQSVAFIFGPFAAPANVPQALWGAGNKLTCQLDATLFTVGSIGTPLYTLFLCFYSLRTVKNSTSIDNSVSFAGKHVEKSLHLIIFLFNVVICTMALATGTFNTYLGGNFCNISALPTGCRANPKLWGECDEDIARYSGALALVCHLALPLLCLLGILICMGKICWHIFVTRPRIFQQGGSAVSSPIALFLTSCWRGGNRNKKRCSTTDFEEIEPNLEDDGFRATTQPTATIDTSGNIENLVRIYKKEILIQACLFVLGFLMTYIFSLSLLLMNVIFQRKVPMIVNSLGAIFLPASGLCNILVFTRPKVISVRRAHPEISYFRAFVMVVRAGGCVPMVSVNSQDSAEIEIIAQREYPSSRETPPVNMDAQLSSMKLLRGSPGNHCNLEEKTAQKQSYKFYDVPATLIQNVNTRIADPFEQPRANASPPLFSSSGMMSRNISSSRDSYSSTVGDNRGSEVSMVVSSLIDIIAEVGVEEEDASAADDP